MRQMVAAGTLLGAEAGGLRLLRRAADLPFLTLPERADLVVWLSSSPASDVVAAAARVAAEALLWWMLGTTAAWLVAGATGSVAAIRAVRRLTLPPLRPILEKALVVSVSAGMSAGPAVAAASPSWAPSPGVAALAGHTPVLEAPPEAPGQGDRARGLAPPEASPRPFRSPGALAGSQPPVPGASAAPAKAPAPGSDVAQVPGPPTPPAPVPGAGSPVKPVPGPVQPEGGPPGTSSASDPGAKHDPGQGVRPPAAGWSRGQPLQPSTPKAPPGRPAPGGEDTGPADLGPAPGRHHIVVPGENLWRIAAREVAAAHGKGPVPARKVAPYWKRVIEANQSTLRSGQPRLIYPGERILLPPLDGGRVERRAAP